MKGSFDHFALPVQSGGMNRFHKLMYALGMVEIISRRTEKKAWQARFYCFMGSDLAFQATEEFGVTHPDMEDAHLGISVPDPEEARDGVLRWAKVFHLEASVVLVGEHKYFIAIPELFPGRIEFVPAK